MADTTKTTLQLTFLTATGTSYAMSFAYPQTDITAEQVDTLMDLIILKNIVTTLGGDLTSIKDGGLVTREFVDLVV
jgi:hypothetical protein